MSAEVSAFSYNCDLETIRKDESYNLVAFRVKFFNAAVISDLEWRSGLFKLFSLMVFIINPKFERNRSVNVWMQANLKLFFCCITKSPEFDSLSWILIRKDKMSMRFTRPRSLDNMPNSIQIHSYLWDITDTESSAFLHPCDFESWPTLHGLVMVSTC